VAEFPTDANSEFVVVQLRAAADAAWSQRWHFVSDLNGDGLITISDTLVWAKWIFFAPGDWLLLMLMSHAPAVAIFLELTPANPYGLLSGIVSGLVWFMAFILYLVAVD